MIRVNILNLNSFLKTVNQCRGRVMMLSKEGEAKNITRQYSVQQEMKAQYQKNGRYLPLSLTFDDPADYMAIVSYYAGDC